PSDDEEVYEAEIVEDESPLNGHFVGPTSNPFSDDPFGGNFAQPASAPGMQPFQVAQYPTHATRTSTPTVTGTCEQHPRATVVHRCTICSAPICRTCTFVFPPNITCCPKCATDTDIKLSTYRKAMIYGAVGCAMFASLTLTLMCSGLLSFVIDLPYGGLIAETMTTLPLCLGLGMSIGSYNRIEGNPATLWVGVIWNALGLIAMLLFMIIIAIGGLAT
ncbi:MAG: hypothetical protein R3C05_30710, partial [Pirellulaceae bacterium]